MKVAIDFSSRIGPGVRGILAQLQGDAQREMIRASGYEVQRLTVDHLRMLAGTRHESANKLGASPSNHLAQAAEKAAAPAALSVLAGTSVTTTAILTINHPGLSRAFRDVRIVPKNAKALTIPIAAVAYNRRARQFNGLFVLGKKDEGNSTGRGVLARRVNGVIEPLYLLVRSVTQKQDRSLLPSNDELGTAAADGARNYLRQSLNIGA